MAPRSSELCRRQLLIGLCAAACTRGKPTGDGTARDTVAPDTSGDTAGSDPCAITPAEGWVEVSLADHPELREEGGSIALSDPDHLLEVIVGRSPGGCWFTAWRICTHGACDVAYEPDVHELVCPCHGSRFAETGAVGVAVPTCVHRHQGGRHGREHQDRTGLL